MSECHLEQPADVATVVAKKELLLQFSWMVTYSNCLELNVIP